MNRAIPAAAQGDLPPPLLRRSQQSLRCLIVALVIGWLLPVSSLGQLRTLRTQHYRLHTDVDQELAYDLAKRLDSMYAEYSRRLAGFGGAAAEPPEGYEVFVFARQADYLQRVGKGYGNSAGIFISERNLLAAYLEGQGPEELRKNLQHEAFHQFAHTALSPQLPVWLNEGMAKYFEEAIWTGREFLVGEIPPRRVLRLRQDMRAGRLVPFDRFMAISLDQWNNELASDLERGTTNYNQAWAMVHFLVNATDPQGKPRYRSHLLQMLQLIHKGTDPAEAFKQSFGTNIKGFQDRFSEWAQRLQPTPRALFLENQRFLAYMLVLLADKNIRFDRLADFRALVVESKLRMEYTEGGFKLTTAEDPEYYFRDAQGRLLEEDELHFSLRAGAPLPDIVCRFERGYQARTRFFLDPVDRKTVQFETLIEAR